MGLEDCCKKDDEYKTTFNGVLSNFYQKENGDRPL